ncbi:MAG: hypothetical protein KKA64_04225 [Nanoarchaeota archaeon]|nr:hypothetical protein [Nanoarchaeota archaeon]
MKSKLAIVSFILGLISLTPLLLWIASNGGEIIVFVLSTGWSILGIILLVPCVGLITGIISIFVIRRNKIGGIWFSIFGILLSLVGFLILFIIFLAIGQAISNVFS